METVFRSVVDALPGLVWTAGPEGQIDFLSQGWRDYAGAVADLAHGPGWQGLIHPEDLVRSVDAWRSILASQRTGEFEARLKRRDGQYRWFLFRASPMTDAAGKITSWCGINFDIDERMRPMARVPGIAALRLDEEGFRTIVETTPECVKVVAQDGTLLLVNPASVTMSGAPTAEAILGLNFYNFVAPEDAARYREFNEKVCSGVNGFLEFDIISVHGVRRHMETHAVPIRHKDGSIAQLGVTRDMTERKLSIENLRRSEAYLAEAQRVSHTGSFGWDPSTDSHVWSAETFRIFQYDPATPITLPLILDRVHPQDTQLMQQAIALANEGRDFDYECRLAMPNSTVKHVHIVGRGVQRADNRMEYIGAVQDVTERRLSEEALSKTRSELAHVTRVMSLGTLAASIAHEINQPLSGIVNNAGACQRMLSADPPNVVGALETARRTLRDANRASDVIQRLRALFSGKSAGAEPVDLNEATREVLALSRAELHGNRVMVRTDFAQNLPLVMGDRVQLQQVILNLLLNASDSLASVEDRPRRLIINTTGEAGSACLSMSDNGAGFDAQTAEKLFEAFYTTKPSGMGIGLSVSRSIIDSHRGRLWATPNDGAPGATFSFSVPSTGPPGAELLDIVLAPPLKDADPGMRSA